MLEEKRVAILFTGALRTFERTKCILFDNLVKPNDAICFFYIESTYSQEGFKRIIVDSWGERHFGTASVLPSTRTEEFKQITNFLLKSKPGISEEVFARRGWSQSYLINSGSILEYYQYKKCFELLLDYEKEHQVKFDVLVRARTDFVIGNVIPIKDFFSHVDKELREFCGDDNVYIRSIGCVKMAQVLKKGNNADDIGSSAIYSNIIEKINDTNLIWTLNLNWLWVGRREVMHLLSFMIYSYGDYDNGRDNVFSSEIQFINFLERNRIQRYLYFNQEHDGAYYDSNTNRNLLSKEGILNPDRKKDFMITIFRG